MPRSELESRTIPIAGATEPAAPPAGFPAKLQMAVLLAGLSAMLPMAVLPAGFPRKRVAKPCKTR